MSKAIINIAYGLNHSKEVRDFFLDVTEKVRNWANMKEKKRKNIYQ